MDKRGLQSNVQRQSYRILLHTPFLVLFDEDDRCEDEPDDRFLSLSELAVLLLERSLLPRLSFRLLSLDTCLSLRDDDESRVRLRSPLRSDSDLDETIIRAYSYSI